MPYYVDQDGAPIPAGQHRVQWRSELHLGAIPAWMTGLTASSNVEATYTPTASPAAGNIPHLLLATSAANNRRATVTGPTFDTSILKRLRLDIATWGGAWSEVGNRRSYFMGFSDNAPVNPLSEGLFYSQMHSNGAAGSIDAYHGGAVVAQTINTGRAWRGLTEYNQHSLVLDFTQKEVWLLNGDQMVVGAPLGANMPTGSLTPFARVTAQDSSGGAAASMRLLRFDIAAEY